MPSEPPRDEPARGDSSFDAARPEGTWANPDRVDDRVWMIGPHTSVLRKEVRVVNKRSASRHAYVLVDISKLSDTHRKMLRRLGYHPARGFWPDTYYIRHPASPTLTRHQVQMMLLGERDGWRCYYCGRTPPAVTLDRDHVIPRSRGGANDLSNLVLSCRWCNGDKSHRTPREWALGIPETAIKLPDKPQRQPKKRKKRKKPPSDTDERLRSEGFSDETIAAMRRGARRGALCYRCGCPNIPSDVTAPPCPCTCHSQLRELLVP